MSYGGRVCDRNNYLPGAGSYGDCRVFVFHYLMTNTTHVWMPCLIARACLFLCQARKKEYTMLMMAEHALNAFPRSSSSDTA